MNILMLGRWLPPSRRPVRATREYQFARRLARSHQLTLAFINDQPDAAGPISALRSEFNDLEFASVPRRWKSLSGALSLAVGESCTLSYFRSEALRTRLADRLRRAPYGLVLVTSSSMVQYTQDIDPATPLLMDFGSVDSEWWLAQAARSAAPSGRFFRTEAARLRQAESAVARRAVRCIVATPEAARTVQSFAPGVPTSVIENGFDMEFSGTGLRPKAEPTVVVSAGAADEKTLAAIVEFLRGIAAPLRSRRPQLRFALLTRDPVVRLKAAAGLSGLELVGPSADPRGILHPQAVAVAPPVPGIDLRASVLEPMAAGVPVVGATYVFDELGADASQALVACETGPDYSAKIARLLDDAARRAEVGARGKAYVAARYSWDVLTQRLGDIVDELARSAAGSAPLAGVSPAERRAGYPLNGDGR
jgi:polysaccharide biosynthesis protein PslH